MNNGILRILSVLAAVMLCIGAVPALAAEVGETIFIENAGFEDATDTENPGWSYMKDANIIVDTGKAHTGKNSIKITNEINNHPWAMQTLTGFTNGAMYEVSAWLSTDFAVLGNTGSGFKIEQYDANGNSIVGGDSGGETLNINTLGQWNRLSIYFQVLKDTKFVKLYLRSYNIGVTWFDDVEVTLSGGPEPYSFYADHVFHYPDEKTGTVYVRLDSYYGPETPEATEVSAAFTFLDGETVLDKKENVKISDGAAKYTYPVSIMKEKKKQYVLKTELFDKNEETLHTWSQNMYVYDRPKYMPENGICYIDGERFDPVIGYHWDPESYAKVAPGGFNVAQLGYSGFKDEAAWAAHAKMLEENGLKALICLYVNMNPAGHPSNVELVKEVVGRYKDDNRIFAWAVMDEPLGGGVTEEKKQWLEDSYRIIRDIDDNHPVYIVDYNNHEESIKYCDVFVADAYAHDVSATHVSTIIEPLAAAHPRVSVYELAASYKQNGKFPPMNTMRASVYRGLLSGHSHGTGFYAIDDAIAQSATDPERIPLFELDVWPDMTVLLKEELPILFDYSAGEEVTAFNATKEGEIYEELLWETWFHDGQMYLMAHNRSKEAAEFNIPLVSKNGKIRVGSYTAEPIGLTATGEKKGEGSISFTLEQEEIALYKINPAEKVDLTNIDAPSFNDLEGDYAWAADAVAKTQTLGIVNEKGEGIFAPGEPITRGDLAMFLIRTLGFTSDSTENFADVPAEAEYAKEVAIGKALGILQGVGENLYNPEAPITRQDMMTICARGMKMAEKLAAADASVLDPFHDKANVADYALESVSAMIASGIIKGDDAGYLNPTGNTRRAEAAVIMQRILGAEKVEVAAPTEPTVENEVIEFAAPSEEVLAKYNRSIALLQGLGTPAITPEASITNGEAEAVLSAILGYAYDGFGENHLALTTQGAAEAFVKLLGYEVYTQRDGGYMGTASMIELTSGVNISETHLRGGEFAVMLENALGIYLADPTSYGENADGRYVESEDTLLTRYRHLTLFKGVLEQNENTGLSRGKVAVGTNLLEAGETDAKAFIGQRVEAYTEGEDNTIVYIRANKNVAVTTVDADKIDSGETNMNTFVYEDENGHTKSITISGAQVLYNGKYKTNPDVNTITPAQGTVTLIENGGSSAAYVLVEAYNNYVVERIWAEDNQIFFKNRAELVWDETDTSKRLTMEGAAFDALKEWNVISLYESEDGSVVRAAVSTKTAAGTVAEISDEDITVGETAYSLAESIFGTIELGEDYTFLLDAAGRIAGINDEAVTKNYAYFTKISQSKGIDGRVQMRIFTKEGEMKVVKVRDTVQFNGVPTEAATLVTNPILMSGTTPVDQLIVLETVGEEETEEIVKLETAREGSDFTNFYTTPSTFQGAVIFHGHVQNTIAHKYRVGKNTILFVVPEEYSDNVADYGIRRLASFVHGQNYYNTKMYDLDEDMYIGAMVQKIKNIATVDARANTGVVSGFGMALDEATGEVVRTVTLLEKDKKVMKFQSEDFGIQFGEGVMTNIYEGETEVTGTVPGTQVIKETILPNALNIGDVVMYTVKERTTDVISGMRVLFRAETPIVGEKCQQGMDAYFNYSELTYAYARVERLVDGGMMMTPGQWERLYLFAGNGGTAPVILVEDGEVELVSPQAVLQGDMVYVQKNNPYQTITVIYR